MPAQEVVKTANCIRNTRWLALLPGVLAVIALCCSCADKVDHNSYVQERVNSVIYLSWISQQLDHDDFQLKSFGESSLVLTKSSGGESESVNVQVTPSNGKLHVEIAYAIDSD
jgi:hypothetical protein